MIPLAVELAAPDGVVLRGQRFGGGGVWATLLHDEGGDLDDWRPLLGDLLGLGLTVLSLDLRGHGASDGDWEPERAVEDALAALAFARSEGARGHVLVGAGAGATAALAAAGRRSARALVLLSPRAALPGLDPEALRESTAPKLIVAAADDADAVEVHARAIGWTVLQAHPVAAHGTGLLHSDWGEDVCETIAAFLRDYV